MQQEHETELLIGSAPCISFRTLLCPCGMKTQTDRVQDEHPAHASNWCMPDMRELLNDGRVHLVQGPMCHWRLASTGRGKTRCATSSSRLATLLAREHAGENRRARFIGRNEMIAAAMYSPRLVNQQSGNNWLTTDGCQSWTDSRLS